MPTQPPIRRRPGPLRRALEDRRTEQFVCRLLRRERFLFDLLLEVDKSQGSMSGIVLVAVQKYAKELGIDWDSPDPDLVRRHLPPEVAAELLALSSPRVTAVPEEIITIDGVFFEDTAR